MRLFQPLRAIVDFALPPRCPACGVVVEEDHRFCLECWRKLDFLGGGGCAGCGLPFDQTRPPDSLCLQCLAAPPRHDGVRAAVTYGEIARAVALKLKHGRKPGVARIIARHLARHVEAGPQALLVPVPLHRWRIWSRGFNQSALIADAVSALTGVPVLLDGIERRKATPLLRGLGAAARARAVRGAFALDPARKPLLAGRTVYLVDDVYTSGATAGACAGVLKRAGAARVVVLCRARVLRDD